MKHLAEIRRYLKRHRNNLYLSIPTKVFWGTATRKKYTFLMASQWWKYEELARLQTDKLSRLLTFTYRYVPFYQEVFKKLGAVPQDIKRLEDLTSFPIIDKSFVNSHHDEFIPRIHFPRAMKVSTSGSSGQLLYFFWHPDYLNMKRAANYRFESWAGKKWAGREVEIKNPLSNLPGTSLFMINHKSHRWTFNTGDLSDANLARMVNALNEIRPDTISGYPSLLHMLARYIIDQGHILKKYPVSILTTSEILTDNARECIEKAFHSKLFDWYGQNEGCASAAQCEHGNYHMNMEYNYIEFVEKDGLSRIVGTNLENLAFPLIRYDTGDIGEFAGFKCPCGRGLPLMKLAGGRIHNVIKTRGGKKFIHVQHFCWLLHANIREFQIIQNSIDEIDLFIVKNDIFSEDNLKEIRSSLISVLGEDMKINIHCVKKIDRGPNGKYQAILSNI